MCCKVFNLQFCNLSTQMQSGEKFHLDIVSDRKWGKKVFAVFFVNASDCLVRGY